MQGDDDDAKRKGDEDREEETEREWKGEEQAEADESAMPPDVEWVDMNKQSNDGENKDGGGSGTGRGVQGGCMAGVTGKRATEKANKTSGTWERRPEQG